MKSATPDARLVSVIIPTYNQPGMLLDAIHSALAQTYAPLEIVVVDDGSTDDTAAVLEPYVGRGMIRYEFQENKRQAAARNRGIRASRGELIAFLDHDDLWAPDKIERQVRLFDDPAVGIVYCGAREIDTAGGTLWEKGVDKYCRGMIFDRLLFDHFITNSSVVIRRACLERTGLFAEELFGVDDMHMWLKICHDFAADFVPDILVSCRNHAGNMKKDPVVVPEKRFRALIDIFRRFGLDTARKAQWRKLNADYYFFLGFQARKTSWRKAVASVLRSISYQPSRVRCLALLKLLIPGYYQIGGLLRREP